MGWFWFKGQHVGTGQANVKRYTRQLSEAPDGYKHFDARDEGWTKVVLRPAA